MHNAIFIPKGNGEFKYKNTIKHQHQFVTISSGLGAFSKKISVTVFLLLGDILIAKVCCADYPTLEV